MHYFANISIWEAVLLQIKFIKHVWLLLVEDIGKGCIEMLWQLRVPQMEMKCH